ncbi:MAG: nicotinate (nicotinamide) nucleotide adenylyltransferase [Planctomycetaceae bacterium]|nr:nicotinate (nicotinamide) nucleotide adenylyltransferase [Planctomycetaceae bacterium]
MRLGVFGGSFDPVHLGHLQLARSCARQAALDRVLFVPAAQQPLKPAGATAAAADRLAMVQTAVAAEEADAVLLAVSTIELDRAGPSYTVDTLAALAQEHPGAELFFLMGADSLADLPQWRDPRRICELATPLVVARAGEAPPDFDVLAPYATAERLEQIRGAMVHMPPAPISSTDIRRRIAAGRPWQDLVPAAVAQYIEARGLYR